MECGIVLNVLHGANGSCMMDYVVSLSVAKHFQAPPGSITRCRCLCRAAAR